MSDTEKSFPLNYPNEAVTVIDALTIGEKPKVMGSMGNRTQLYAGDYDLMELVKTNYKRKPGSQLATRLADVVKRLLRLNNCYVADIKCGIVKEWDVLKDVYLSGNKVLGYDADRVRRIYSSLPAQLKTEKAEKLLVDRMTPSIYFDAIDEFKYHIVRWTAKELIAGEKKLVDGRTYTVAEGIVSPSLTKVDAVAWVGGRYSDFSCIYIFENDGKVLNGMEIDPNDDLRESLCYYKSKGNYFKMAKRYYSIAKLKDDKVVMEKLNGILNSDLGRLYSIISDANTLLFLMEEGETIPIEKVRSELAGFRSRLGNVYNVSEAESDGVLKRIASLETLPADKEGREKLEETLKKLVDFFEGLLARYSKKELYKLNLLTVSKAYGGC